MIHFDFEDRYEDELIVGSALPLRDGVLLSVIAHVLFLLWFQFGPNLHLFQASPEELEARRQELLRQQEKERDDRRFVFVQPRVDLEALKSKPRADLSDLNRQAQARERAVKPENPLPFARGNSSERIEATPQEQAKGPETPVKPDPTPPQPEPQEQIARALPPADSGAKREPTTSKPAPGALGDALRNLERYVQNETFNNPQGGLNDPGATIQFDTKGVEFGPWLRRFVAQVRRNWFVPYAAMTFRGRVVLQFNIHKDGHITDISVVDPSGINAFNLAANNAILGSNPTEPLPPEYPDPKAFFTVTFYYNESPPVN
ncbi:MAG TPA: TonB family protein [Vicinamibacterales bacterium]|nr:TonB family protein [Vicinamibacterales bacterium]